MRAQLLRPPRTCQMHRRHIAHIPVGRSNDRHDAARLHRKNIAVVTQRAAAAHMAKLPRHAQPVPCHMHLREFRRPLALPLNLHEIHQPGKIHRIPQIEVLLTGPSNRPGHVLANAPAVHRNLLLRNGRDWTRPFHAPPDLRAWESHGNRGEKPNVNAPCLPKGPGNSGTQRARGVGEAKRNPRPGPTRTSPDTAPPAPAPAAPDTAPTTPSARPRTAGRS